MKEWCIKDSFPFDYKTAAHKLERRVEQIGDDKGNHSTRAKGKYFLFAMEQPIVMMYPTFSELTLKEMYAIIEEN